MKKEKTKFIYRQLENSLEIFLLSFTLCNQLQVKVESLKYVITSSKPKNLYLFIQELDQIKSPLYLHLPSNYQNLASVTYRIHSPSFIVIISYVFWVEEASNLTEFLILMRKEVQLGGDQTPTTTTAVGTNSRQLKDHSLNKTLSKFDVTRGQRSMSSQLRCFSSVVIKSELNAIYSRPCQFYSTNGTNNMCNDLPFQIPPSRQFVWNRPSRLTMIFHPRDSISTTINTMDTHHIIQYKDQGAANRSVPSGEN